MMAMNLVLFGSGEFTPEVNDIDEYLISKYKPRSVAILPTAAGAEPDASKWIAMAQAHYQKYNLEVLPIPVFDKAQANQKELISPLKQADWIFFSGGNPGYLLEVLKGSELWKIVLKRLEAGALLLGSSAGAMVMGKYLLSPSFNPTDERSGRIWQNAFGLVDYSIIPHFDHFKKHKGFMRNVLRMSLSRVRSSWMGIDENTAIIFSNLEPIVRGLGGVEIHNSTDTFHLTKDNT